jgi:NTE family protein
VLSGAAARGPYQAGALAELIPTLRAEGHWPVVILGTSSGALNAALLAQFADKGDQAGEHVAETWQRVGVPFANPWRTLPVTTVQLITRIAGVPFIPPVTSLLDTGPLWQFARDHFQPEQLAANMPGLVETLGVAATWCPPGRQAAARTRLFVQGSVPAGLSVGQSVDVVRTQLRVDHLLASAAIPAVFPPVQIKTPENYRGDYIDGGVRLNGPIQAALAFGVNRLVVVSGHSVRTVDPTARPQAGSGPDLAASMAISLRAVLTDGLSDDLSALQQQNAAAQGPSGQVPYRFVGPYDGQLANLAAEYFKPYRLRVWSPYWPIGRLLAAAGTGIGIGRDELLSLIFFEQGYITKQIELGRKRAREVLDEPWQL